MNKDGDYIKHDSRSYQSGFHAFFDKKYAEHLREWIGLRHHHINSKVVPITVKKEDILYVGRGQKRGIDEDGDPWIYKEMIDVVVVMEFDLKKKDYEKAMRNK